MKKQRILPMLIIILLTLITLSAVSAAEDAASDITGIDENDEISLEQSALDDANEEPILEESPDDENNLANTDETLLGEATGTFTDLNNLINGATNFEINLTRDYAYNSSSDSEFKYGVRIDHGIIINGNGHTINGSGEARIFTVISHDVILRNINFVGGHATGDDREANGGAINGPAIAINCTFTNNRADMFGEAMYGSTAINCTFANNNNGKAIFDCRAISCTFKDGDYADEDSSTSDRLFIQVDSYESFYNSGEPYYVDVKYGDDPEDLVEHLKMNIAFYNNDSQIVKNESIYTEEAGKFDLNLTPGNYIARVSAAYIPEISPAAFIINITKANSTITVSNITSPYGKENYLYATLLENPGSPVSNATIRVSVNGSETDYVTDGNGKIAIPLKDLPLGTHTATLTFGDNDCYNGNATTAEITIIKDNSAINCNNTYILPYNSSAIVIELKNTDLDKTISGVTLSVEINGSIENYTTNEYGQIEVPINMLNSGNYTATITYAGNETIEGKSKTISIIIKQQKSYIACENVTTLYNSDANIVATLTNDQGNPISEAMIKINLFAGETFKTDSNGQIVVPSSRLAVGEYNAKIIFEEETNYEAASQRIHISISKDATALSAVNVTTEFGKDDTLVISLKDSQNRPIANAKLIVFIANFEEKTTDARGEVKISAKDMEIGVHNIAVLFNGNENYTSSNTTAMINVTKITAIIDVRQTHNTPWGEMAILNITVKDVNGNPVAGIVKVAFRGYEDRYTYYATINETGKGQAKFIADMSPRAYGISITFLGNDHYAAAKEDSTFIVGESKILNLEITANEAVCGEETILTVKGTNGRGESVTINNLDIKVGDNDMKNYEVTGKTVNLGKLATGLTTVQISYRGDYYPTSVNITVNVLKIIPVMTVIGSVVPSGNVSTVKIKVTDENNNPVKGIVTVTVDHGIVSRDTVELDENGDGVVKFSIDNAGTFVIMAKFLGDENYSSIVNDTENLTVTATNNITFDAEINENLTEIMISDALDKDTGQTVNGIIAGSLIKDEDMIVLENITLSQGKGIIKIPEGLKPGTYKAYLILVTEDDKYAFNYGIEFTIAKLATSIEVKDVTATTVDEAIEGEVVEYFNFTLKDSKGYALANKDVQVKIDGVTYNLTTDANGVAKIKIDLSKAKTYNLAIFYQGDNEYFASFEQSKITVNAQVPALTANSPTYLATATSKSITATLKDAKGNALANKNVTFTVNGKTYKATTDAKGQATVKLSLTAANTYTVKIDFAGDSIYAASTVSAKVKLNKEKTKINAPKKTFKKAKKVKKVVITLKNSKGKVLASKKVTLTVNKKTFTAKTNAKGKATFKVKNLKKKGSKKYTVKFAGDSQYQAVQKTGKIKIK